MRAKSYTCSVVHVKVLAQLPSNGFSCAFSKYTASFVIQVSSRVVFLFKEL